MALRMSLFRSPSRRDGANLGDTAVKWSNANLAHGTAVTVTDGTFTAVAGPRLLTEVDGRRRPVRGARKRRDAVAGQMVADLVVEIIGLA